MELITILVPIVIGAATTQLFDLFKRGVTLLDKAPTVVKQVAVAVLAFGLTKLSALLGIQLSTTDIAGLTATDISTILSALIAYLLHNSKVTAKVAANTRGGARLAVLMAIVGIGAACVHSVAAQPVGAVVVADLRVGAVCGGPASMTGCLVSLYDSTANVALASSIAVARGDTLWRSRPCTSNESVVIGGTFVGTRAGASNSAPVGARATGTCTAQAGQPSPVIVVEIVP